MSETNADKRRIHVLEKNMINMIAAGEVIERPASVVKELLENSIDAGATKITLTCEDGGRGLIQVTDNGCGISAGDIPTAFQPHATSKLSCFDDLSHISTMGFRGEALASIASVAQVRIVSRQADSIEANSLEIDCGDFGPVTPASSDYGTTISCRNLFYKLPARRKFLRTANTEFGHISEQFTRIALANCDIELRLLHNGKQIYYLPAGQSIDQRIGELINKDVRSNLIAASSDERGMFISARICSPAMSRSSAKDQYCFLNGRYIRDKFISHAIKEAYRGMLEPGKYPIVFLFIEMDAACFDVNVHPTKIEVRFENSNLVHSQVLAALREKLLNLKVQINGDVSRGASDIAPAGAADMSAADAASLSITESLQEAMSRNKSEYDARVRNSMKSFFDSASSSPSSAGPRSISGSGSGEFRPYSLHRPTNAAGFEPPLPATEPAAPHLNWMQVQNSYIVIETETGMDVIDQHAFHERIIYEKMYARVAEPETERLETQKLLIPDTFELRAGQEELLELCSGVLHKLGIDVAPFGPGVWAVQSFPTLLRKAKPAEFMAELIEKLAETHVAPGSEELVHFILDTASCKAAIKAGQKLSEMEVIHLLEEAKKTQRSGRCPHGRPARISFSKDALDKQFKRTGF
ncbi:MAG: DNA mismatch repair endonuclease MutL [Phycisphaerae bacterium]